MQLASTDTAPAVPSCTVDVGRGEAGSPQAKALENTWKTEPGVIGWLRSVDHKEIGKRYLVTAFLFLFAGVFLYVSFPLGQAPNAGWFNYVPYASLLYNPGPNIDVYALGMIFLGLSTTVGSVNFVVSLFRTRAPGMSINRVPVLVWGTLTASIGNLLAVPAVSLAFLLLWFDRQVGTHFFDFTGGGKPLLWQHLFWMFGHPWVYAIVLPAMGIVSDALPTFCRRPLVGYTAVALSTISTMILGFGVWVHHMFATGLPPLSLSFFGSASFVIAIPSAVAVFAWIACSSPVPS